MYQKLKTPLFTINGDSALTTPVLIVQCAILFVQDLNLTFAFGAEGLDTAFVMVKTFNAILEICENSSSNLLKSSAKKLTSQSMRSSL